MNKEECLFKRLQDWFGFRRKLPTEHNSSRTMASPKDPALFQNITETKLPLI